MNLPNFINFEPLNELRRAMGTNRLGNFRMPAAAADTAEPPSPAVARKKTVSRKGKPAGAPAKPPGPKAKASSKKKAGSKKPVAAKAKKSTVAAKPKTKGGKKRPGQSAAKSGK